MAFSLNKTIFLFLLFFIPFQGFSQKAKLGLLEMPDTLHKKRLFISSATGLAIYGGFSITLWEAWYKNSEITSFHSFNDWGEWEKMDKVGHFVTAWIESYYLYCGAKWTGLPRKKAILVSSIAAFGLQATVEVMDGFSADWGFSWSDFGFNALGAGFFAAQELIWEEQRIKLKVSASAKSYSSDPIYSNEGTTFSSLERRAEDLYGSRYVETFWKDYNAQTLWMSANIHSFLKNKSTSKFPKWLNIAVGYGAENMFGGFGNGWSEGENHYSLSGSEYPRYKQFFLSFDVDLARMGIKKPFWKFMIGALNWIKIPSPTLEVNTLGEMKFHPIYW